MISEKYFPEGGAFINREKEREYLINRVKANKHTVLMAPRRYGKTSLVIKVANELDTPYSTLDFLAAYNAEYVRDQIVEKISRLVVELMPNVHKATAKLIHIFRRMKPEVSLGVFGQRLNLTLSNQPLSDITELLLKLDETAKQFKNRAVIFMDEFQQISKLKNYHSIEAAIRHAVERSERVAYVFSGSNRQLLEQMFGDQSRPLYRLCQTASIDRMKKNVYIDHLQILAKKKWKKQLSADLIEEIFVLTELHPFYVNVLCQLLWERDDLESTDAIYATWHHYVKTQKHIISHDFVGLSVNQRKVLVALAKSPLKEVQSAEVISQLKLSASSIQQAVDTLIRKDMVYRSSDQHYCVLDPAVRFYLNVILWETN